MIRIIGLDVGEKRIGVSLSDPLGITAQGLTVLVAKDSLEAMKRIKEIINEHEAQQIVVGLPLNMDGSQGPQAKRIIEFCDYLKEEISIPLKLWDERLTTLEVERIMIKADVTRKKRKKNIDKLAAQVILQSYLDTISTK